MAPKIPRQSMMTAYAGGVIYYATKRDRAGYLSHMLGLMIAAMPPQHGGTFK